ncbi:MAG TPA: M1 family metallopeptidase [Saprospiraceae bacterium]|nr:M1 family metallopeptidase [Saprospiraceae bacterium]
MKPLAFYIFLLLLLQACSSSRPSAKSVVRPAEEDSLLTEEMEFRQLDTMVVSPEMDENLSYSEDEEETVPYRSSHPRRWDLLHMSLQLKFDWENEQVHGKASLRLKPLFYPTDSLELDAKSFDIHTISAGGQSKNLVYRYDGEILKISLGKKYSRKDTLDLFLEYRGNPSRNQTTGSAAITDDNGLYFIDPRGTDPNLPTQLWSQGETEYNSRWFPTIDKPNERCTGEISLTVPDSMLTLSNGLLVKSTRNTDHTRTDTWVMDQPIAPYLYMIAAGPFAKVTESWQGIPVEYYVDKPYGAYAKEIFNHTPEMLEFFSKKLDLKYPWKKFSQVVVRKYVSGAMENVTAVVFGDFIQKTHRELIDDPNDNIVAHELFHHWFGDYVTCESWANLTLNEGFANYAEYLWSEHKYGKYEADRHRENELMGYLSSVSFGQAHDLIDYHYADKENMFDAHSYNKGGLVLHMLRNYVGEEAFWTTLNLYLRRHAFQSVEVHDLRLAFEETTGEDLNWFFNQWYLKPGHPTLSYTHTFDASTKTVLLQVRQTQEKEFPGVFRLPLDADLHFANGEIVRKRLWLDHRNQQFELEVDSKPSLIVLDPDRILLTEWDEPELTANEYKIQWKSCNNLQLKLNALNALTEERDYIQIWREAIQEPYWYFRLRALDYPPSLKPEDINKLKWMALRDPHSQVRAAAIRILGEGTGINSLEATLDNILEADSAYVVLGEALKALARINPVKAGLAVKNLQQEKNPYIQEAIAEVLAAENNPASLDYFDQKLADDPSLAANLLDKYLAILKDVPAEVQFSKAGFLFEQSINPNLDKTSKFYFVRALFEVKEMILTRAVHEKDPAARAVLENRVKEVKSWIQEIKEKETDVQLKSILGQFN